MKKPEPLKGKEDVIIDDDRYTKIPIFYKKDIKSAVEWYKEKLSEKHPKWTKAYKSEVKLLDEAFEDVIEVKK